MDGRSCLEALSCFMGSLRPSGGFPLDHSPLMLPRVGDDVGPLGSCQATLYTCGTGTRSAVLLLVFGLAKLSPQ